MFLLLINIQKLGRILLLILIIYRFSWVFYGDNHIQLQIITVYFFLSILFLIILFPFSYYTGRTSTIKLNWITPVIPGIQEAEIRMIIVPKQSVQKVCETPHLYRKGLDVVVCACHPVRMGSYVRRIMIQAAWAKTKILSPK
jgi:hypothetical protein